MREGRRGCKANYAHREESTVVKVYLPDDGEQRTRTFFAFLPVRIKLEIRWWETVTVLEKYKRWSEDAGWYKVAFVDDPVPAQTE
jgi:hypothetical protein